MYQWTNWRDHVTKPANLFNIKQVSGTTHTITPAGETMQQGTPQDQNHFNNNECGTLDAHIAAMLLFNYARQNAWVIEHGEITLRNTKQFPFNNSKKTISIGTVHETTDYIVLVDVVSNSGNVGEVTVTDKLINGFKLAYTGSASEATIKYTVIGGYMR